MTNEDAIKWLENLKNDIGNPHYECLWHYAQAIDEICALLKEQEAVEPTWHQGKAYCGSCGKRIPSKIGARYCHKCGKPLKWNNTITQGSWNERIAEIKIDSVNQRKTY